MTKSKDNILQELEAEKIRRANLTKEDLQKMYLELEKENFPSGQKIKFTADLGECNEIASIMRLFVRIGKRRKILTFRVVLTNTGGKG